MLPLGGCVPSVWSRASARSISRRTTNSRGLGFLVGADVWLNDDWALNFAFRFQDADADSNHQLPLDPTFVGSTTDWPMEWRFFQARPEPEREAVLPARGG